MKNSSFFVKNLHKPWDLGVNFADLLCTRHHSAEQGREAPGECPTSRLSGDAIRSRCRSGDVPWRHRVYPRWIFRPRKLRLASVLWDSTILIFLQDPQIPP